MRIALRLTPLGVEAFKQHGHDVVIHAGAGAGSLIRDQAYHTAGATIVASADEVWEQGSRSSM